MCALTANGQALAVTQATVAADFHKALNVLRNLAMQVALNLEVALDVVAELHELFLGEVVRARVGVDARLGQDLLGRGQANAVNVGQADFNALAARKVDTNKTCHR